MNIRPSILLLAMLAAGCASVNDRPASVEPATAAPLATESGGPAPAVATAQPAEG